MRGRLLQTDDGPHRTEVFELVLPAGARFEGPPHDAGTRELVHCIDGAISCGPADQPLELVPGGHRVLRRDRRPLLRLWGRTAAARCWS